jgi:hypothetical protein
MERGIITLSISVGGSISLTGARGGERKARQYMVLSLFGSIHKQKLMRRI